MKMDPFIEAEEAAGHSVKRCCELFEVSRAAYYQRRQGVVSVRELSDAELTEQIREVHAESNGTYGSPRVAKELRKRGVACGRRRVRRLMRLAGLEGRAKKRWRKTTIPDPDLERARDRGRDRGAPAGRRPGSGGTARPHDHAAARGGRRIRITAPGLDRERGGPVTIAVAGRARPGEHRRSGPVGSGRWIRRFDSGRRRCMVAPARPNPAST